MLSKNIRYRFGVLLRRFGISPGIIKQIKFFDAFKSQYRLLPNAEIIFDVGAYDGRTVECYRRYYSKSKIYSFEPFSKSFEKLNEYKKRTEDEQLEVYPYAITDKDGPVSFFSNKLAATNSVLPFGEEANTYNSQMKLREEITVSGMTLDTFCNEKQIDRIDILKMDIQGGELLALEGAKHLLEKKVIQLLYLEVEFQEFYQGQPLFHHLVEYLEKYGYQMYSLTDISVSDKGQWLAGDAIFVVKKPKT